MYIRVRGTGQRLAVSLPLLQKWGWYVTVDTKAKCRHLKKITPKGTLRQVFIRVYKLEIQSATLVFSTKL